MAGYGCSGHQAQGPVTTRAHLAVKHRDVTRLWKGRRLQRPGHNLVPRLQSHRVTPLRFVTDLTVSFTHYGVAQDQRMKLS